MKKTLKKALALTLTLIIALTLSLTAFAAELTKGEAEALALSDAGYSAQDVIYIRSSADYDDWGKEYEIEFLVEKDGRYIEYDYEITASGRILSRDWEYERKAPANVQPSAPKVEAPKAPVVKAAAQGNDVGAEAAKAAAVEAFGFAIENVSFLKVRKGYDDGRAEYEVEFRDGYNAKYSCDVIASSGVVIDKDIDYARNIFDKIELFVEVVIAWLLGR